MPNVSSITDVGVYGAFPMNAPESWWEDHRAESLQTQVRKVGGLIEVLEAEVRLGNGAPRVLSGAYDEAQICPNGHVANDAVRREPERSKTFCDRCGEKTLTRCQNSACGAVIRGAYMDELGVVAPSYGPPAFCQSCGGSFPWTERAIQSAIELATESGDLNESEQQQFRESVDLAARDTPKAQLAGTRIARLMKKMGKTTVDALHDILIDVLSDAAKKMIWPGG